MIVHLTNGSFFNSWWMKQTGCSAVSFNEAMMSGPVSGNPFDDEFISLRAQYHRISKEDYLMNIQPFLDVVNQLNQVDELVLWFGFDAFCQMNLLTIYHVLKQHGYHGVVKTVLFDENEPWEKIFHQQPVNVNWEAMADLYQKVLIERKQVYSNNEIMDCALALYFDLYNDNGRLNQMIRQYPSMNEEELIVLLMEHSKEEGLSDVQALEMIRKIREEK